MALSWFIHILSILPGSHTSNRRPSLSSASPDWPSFLLIGVSLHTHQPSSFTHLPDHLPRGLRVRSGWISPLVDFYEDAGLVFFASTCKLTSSLSQPAELSLIGFRWKWEGGSLMSSCTAKCEGLQCCCCCSWSLLYFSVLLSLYFCRLAHFISEQRPNLLRLDILFLGPENIQQILLFFSRSSSSSSTADSLICYSRKKHSFFWLMVRFYSSISVNHLDVIMRQHVQYQDP